jgi:hypothetical protein
VAALTSQRLSPAGTAPTYAAASVGGDTAPVGKDLFLHVFNGSGASITVTVVTPGTVNGLAIADAALVIPAGDQGFVPLAKMYRNPSTGLANITYSAVTTVEVAVLQLPA